MYRLRDGSVDWCELERIAAEQGRKLIYRRARCEHGRTREQTCVDCEGGYVQDTSEYANVSHELLILPSGDPAIAVSDDGCDVAYLARPPRANRPGSVE